MSMYLYIAANSADRLTVILPKITKKLFTIKLENVGKNSLTFVDIVVDCFKLLMPEYEV